MLQVTAGEERQAVWSARRKHGAEQLPSDTYVSEQQQQETLLPAVGSAALGWCWVFQLSSDLHNFLISPICSSELEQLSTKLITSKPSAVGVCLKKMKGCPALHWRWDLHVYEDLKESDTSKHSFVEMHQAFLQLRKHLRGQAVVHTNIQMPPLYVCAFFF